MEKANYIFIKTEIIGNAFFITLARPQKRNAFTPTMLSELSHAFTFANTNQNIWSIVIKAEGPVFCAGMDLNVFHNPSLDTLNPEVKLTNRPLGDILTDCNKPIIAILDGPVLAGGMIFVAEATFVFSNINATMCLPEVKRGLFPFQVMNSLSKILPFRKILELSILAEEITASEAKNMGLITSFFESDKLEIFLEKFLAKLHSNSPFAISKGIEMSKAITNLNNSEKNIQLKSALEALKNSDDAKEGFMSFNEKRMPIWQKQ